MIPSCEAIYVGGQKTIIKKGSGKKDKTDLDFMPN
jgi:hypothetical protein